VRKIDGLKPIDEVFANFEAIFKDFFWKWYWLICLGIVGLQTRSNIEKG
jgi:hypothetical protein